MSRYDFTAQRLYVNAPLKEAAQIDLNLVQTNYVRNVLRLSDGAAILLFNGRDGEWQSAVAVSHRKHVTLTVHKMTRPQEPRSDLSYLFAPLKHARLDYMVEKAVEMGASLLRPVLTRRTQTSRINSDRMRAHAIEAAEQCGILTIPDIAPAVGLTGLLDTWDNDRLLIFCDEDAPSCDPLAALRQRTDVTVPGPLAILVGPEGGFEASEREALLGMPCVLRLPLGPRILRADTAAVAALALVQSTLGDWRG
ncbi:MAG TPA: 16S rRNA (uracil(1498)-N(3))-methyltransferase [Methylocella sp.]|nr:16S rRNA (uracil(1498)-N(3))-methyltransferase [Methylocella sp.]